MGARREGGQGAAQVMLGCVGCSRITGSAQHPAPACCWSGAMGGARPPRLTRCCDQLDVGVALMPTLNARVSMPTLIATCAFG